MAGLPLQGRIHAVSALCVGNRPSRPASHRSHGTLIAFYGALRRMARRKESYVPLTLQRWDGFMKRQSFSKFEIEWEESSANPEAGMAYGGLCGGCDNAETCHFRKARGPASSYCHEFTAGGAPSADAAAKAPPPAGATLVGDASSAKWIGLCSNCTHRDTCLFPKHEGGIWHCEEYE